MGAEEMTTTPGLIASETPAQVAWDLYDGHPEISLALPQQVALIQDLRQVTSPDVPQMRNETEGQADAQASSAVGGIDFNSDQFMLFTQNSDGEIDFSFDPQFVKSLSSASGFSPTIAGIQPLPNLKDFLNTPFAITP